MSKELKAFRKICKNLNNYQSTDEYKKNKELIETTFKTLEMIKELYPNTWKVLLDYVSKKGK